MAGAISQHSSNKHEFEELEVGFLELFKNNPKYTRSNPKYIRNAFCLSALTLSLLTSWVCLTDDENDSFAANNLTVWTHFFTLERTFIFSFLY